MNRLQCLRSATAAFLVVASLAASAQVNYSLQAFSAFTTNVIGSFSFTVPTFFTLNTTVPAASFSSCSVVAPAGDACVAAVMEVDTTSNFSPPSADNYDAVNFRTTSAGPVYYFANGALGAFGVYNSVLLGSGQQATLTVSAVPEPCAAWMLLGGLALATLRLRLAHRD